jgi:hypothetical protein
MLRLAGPALALGGVMSTSGAVSSIRAGFHFTTAATAKLRSPSNHQETP